MDPHTINLATQMNAKRFIVSVVAVIADRVKCDIGRTSCSDEEAFYRFSVTDTDKHCVGWQKWRNRRRFVDQLSKLLPDYTVDPVRTKFGSRQFTVCVAHEP